MRPTLPLIAALLLAPVAELLADTKPLSTWEPLVRKETWAEKWPDADGKLETRQVTAEVWTQAMQASLDAQGALQAAESQSASPAKPPAVDQRSAFQQTESKPQTGTSDSSEALATPAIKKPSGTPLAPISDPGPEFADEKRLQSQQPSGLVWGELEKH
jgi:hypothetical protein